MISYEVFCKLHDYAEKHGLNVAQIARKLALDSKAVAKWLNVKSFTPRQSTVRRSKLDSYKTQIVSWLEPHPYSAVQIFQRLKENGYEGGYSIVTDCVRIVRPRRQSAFLTLSFEAGECAQMGWGEYGSVNVGSTRRRLSFFVMVLCDSRFMYVEFTVSQTMEHFAATGPRCAMAH